MRRVGRIQAILLSLFIVTGVDVDCKTEDVIADPSHCEDEATGNHHAGITVANPRRMPDTRRNAWRP